jgi:hypothetical protein
MKWIRPAQVALLPAFLLWERGAHSRTLAGYRETEPKPTPPHLWAGTLSETGCVGL